VQLRAVKRRHVDVLMALEERFIRLQPVEVVGAQAAKRAQTTVAEPFSQSFRESLGVPLRCSGVEFLALVDIEENALRRLPLPPLQFLLRGGDEVGKGVVACGESLDSLARQRRLVGVLGIELPQAGDGEEIG
jgi:hypothetical protein